MADEAISPSVLKGLLTSEGLANCIRMANNGGWHIYPTKFCISDILGEISTNRTTLDMFETWYEAPISGRIVQSAESIEFLCTVPPGVTADVMPIREIYIMAESTDKKEFLLGLCGIDGTAYYDPAGSIKFRILINIQNLNLMDLFVFKYTQAQELEDHNNDPNAHPDISAAISGVGRPVIVVNNYVASPGQTLFVDSSSGPIIIQLPRTNLGAGSKVEVVDIGWQCHKEENEISIISVDHSIDKRRARFILNQRGAHVRFVYWPAQKNWCVDVGGRLSADLEHTPDSSATSLYYTEYLGHSSSTIIDRPGIVDSKPGDVIFIKTGDPEVDDPNPEQYGVRLPAEPAAGDHVTFIDCNGNWKKNPPVVDGNGHTIIGSADSLVMNRAFGLYTFYYDAYTDDWKVVVQSTRATEEGGLQGARHDQIYWSKVPAETVLTIPHYIVGTSLAVWLDGVLCKKGERTDPLASYEEIGDDGEVSSRIRFWNDIPPGMLITTLC